MVNYIYWHRVKWIDRKIFRGLKINQIVGFNDKQENMEWTILNKECTSVEPYIKFEYLGRTIKTGNGKEDKKEFDKFRENLVTEGENGNV